MKPAHRKFYGANDRANLHGRRMLFLLENPVLAPHLALLRRRAVAQLGSALEWGSRGRGFESRRPDHVSVNVLNVSRLYRGNAPVLETVLVTRSKLPRGFSEML